MDILDSGELILNLVHPRPVKWSLVVQWFSKVLSIPVVAYDDWLDSLEKSGTTAQSGNAAEVEAILEKNPALRLLDLLRSVKEHAMEDLELLGLPYLASQKAQNASGALRNAVPIDESSIEMWVASWKNIGFLV